MTEVGAFLGQSHVQEAVPGDDNRLAATLPLPIGHVPMHPFAAPLPGFGFLSRVSETGPTSTPTPPPKKKHKNSKRREPQSDYRLVLLTMSKRTGANYMGAHLFFGGPQNGGLPSGSPWKNQPQKWRPSKKDTPIFPLWQ